MAGPYGIPTGLPQELDAILRGMLSISDNQQRVELTGHKDTGAGTDVNIRFRGSRATQWVQSHVQSTATDKGGATYSASNYVSSTRVDCRSNRQQDVTVSRNGTNRYYLWLIPVFLEGDGTTYTKFDGATGADQMVFADLGT
jgi:hypothetical protein|tara:strand:- start:7232 stop:7657 length:426 start_codon:yes stop_codon:yes gene_type:complete